MVLNESLKELRLRLLKDFSYDEEEGVLRYFNGVGYGRVGADYGTGYLQVRLGGKGYLVHRLIYLRQTGEYPALIDHIDRDSLNNKWSNLRVTTKQVNAINSGLPSNNKSGVKGVTWHKAGKKWTAQIKHNQVKIHLGSYDSLLDAVGARIQAEQELWYDLR